ncbi:hypothetical protein C1J05_14075 [Sulfitobacter sp. JL08]|nr:hypothetical protein C1J05_14075 [Sulfitobacter sp. JL08]
MRIFIRATRNHLVIEANRSMLKMGSEAKFQMNYNALMHAMAAPDIKVKLFDDRPTRQSRHIRGKAEHLTLF